MVEKNEFRTHGAQAVGMLTSQMESEDYGVFIKWLSKYSKSVKVISVKYLKRGNIKLSQE